MPDATTTVPPLPAADAFETLARWNFSLTAFYLRRWRRQMEWPLRVAQSVSASDVIDSGRAFHEDLLADYREQAETLHACRQVLPDATYGAELLKAQAHARQLIDQTKAQADRIIASAEVRAREIVDKAAPAAPRRSASA